MQLLNNYIHERPLHVAWKRLVRRYSNEWPVGGVRSEVHVFAGEQDLHEVLVGEEAVALRVVEVYELLTVGLGEQKYAIISKKCDKIATSEPLLGRPINPHKGTVG